MRTTDTSAGSKKQPTPWDILGVKRGATRDAIKNAYRSLAKRWHPDKHNGSKAAQEQFIRIKAAYDALMDGEADRHLGAGLDEHGEDLFVRSHPKGDFRIQVSADQLDTGGVLHAELREKGRKRTLEIVIPPQSWPGRQIRAVGGETITLEVLIPPGFELQNEANWVVRLDVPFSFWVEGGDFTLDWPDGDPLEFSITPYPSNETLIARFRGLWTPRGFRGHGIIVLRPEIPHPAKMSKEERAAFERWFKLHKEAE